MTWKHKMYFVIGIEGKMGLLRVQGCWGLLLNHISSALAQLTQALHASQGGVHAHSWAEGRLLNVPGVSGVCLPSLLHVNRAGLPLLVGGAQMHADDPLFIPLITRAASILRVTAAESGLTLSCTTSKTALNKRALEMVQHSNSARTWHKSFIKIVWRDCHYQIV